jgi:hypothetical protein
VLGILLALGGDKLSMPLLTYGGIVCFGFLAMTIGWEAIITRHIVLGSRRRGTSETYSGISAILQGIQFNLIGFFLIAVTVLAYFNNGREVFLQFVRRPGMPLAAIGLLLLLQSLVMFLGYRELNEGSGFMVTMNLVISRMLPGVILLVLGLGAIGLGLFEIIAPTVFDNLGGGFLEMLYEGK